MGIPERVADYLTHELDLDEDKSSIILYSSRVIYSTLFSLFAIIILSLLAGVLRFTLIAVFTNSYLRQFAGGAHATAPYRCATIAAIVFTILGLITKYLSWPDNNLLVFIAVTALIALIAIGRYAPADTHSKPIPYSERGFFKKKALLAWLIWCLFALVVVTFKTGLQYKFLLASTLGLLWESWTLTPWGYRFIAKIDGLLIRSSIERGSRP